jgi:hypothetical protein
MSARGFVRARTDVNGRRDALLTGRIADKAFFDAPSGEV